jgi:hypothetical protein
VQAFRKNSMLSFLKTITFKRLDRLDRTHRDPTR